MVNWRNWRKCIKDALNNKDVWRRHDVPRTARTQQRALWGSEEKRGMTKNNEDRRLLTLPIMFCIADCQMRNVNVRSVNSKRRKTPSSSCLWVSQFRCSFILPKYLLLLPSYINYIVVIKRYDVIYYNTWLSNQQLWTRPLYLYTCRFKLAFAYIYIIIIYTLYILYTDNTL